MPSESSDNKPSRSRYQHRYDAERDIHEFIFYVNDRQTVDAYIGHIEALWRRHAAGYLPSDYVIKFILDISISGMLSLRYAYQQYGLLLKKYPNQPCARLAYITGSPQDIAVAKSFASLYAQGRGHRANQRRFFAPDERDAAIRWLLHGDD